MKRLFANIPTLLTTIAFSLLLAVPALAAVPRTGDDRGQMLGLIFGLGGGALVLIIIISVVTSKGGKNKKKK